MPLENATMQTLQTMLVISRQTVRFLLGRRQNKGFGIENDYEAAMGTRTSRLQSTDLTFKHR